MYPAVQSELTILDAAIAAVRASLKPMADVVEADANSLRARRWKAFQAFIDDDYTDDDEIRVVMGDEYPQLWATYHAIMEIVDVIRDGGKWHVDAADADGMKATNDYEYALLVLMNTDRDPDHILPLGMLVRWASWFAYKDCDTAFDLDSLEYIDMVCWIDQLAIWERRGEVERDEAIDAFLDRVVARQQQAA